MQTLIVNKKHDIEGARLVASYNDGFDSGNPEVKTGSSLAMTHK